jgi:uncharacterized phage protein (TIGR02218 family)
MLGIHYLQDGQIQAMRPRVTFTLTHLWRVERKDGVVKRFASHDKWIQSLRERYEAVGPMPSDMQQSEAGAASDFELAGFLSADSIKASDIHAGRYDGCSVLHHVVDFQRPWMWFRKHRWWIKEINEDGGVFQAKVQGVERFLSIPVGRRYERECDKVLGSAECGAVPVIVFGAAVDAVATPSAKVLGIPSSRMAFTVTSASWPTLPRNGLMTLGKVVWTSGPNKGTEQEIAEHDSRSLALTLEAPFPIKAGDLFTLKSGCDGTLPTCTDDDANRVNYGGVFLMPSTEDTYRKPVET